METQNITRKDTKKDTRKTTKGGTSNRKRFDKGNEIKGQLRGKEDRTEKKLVKWIPYPGTPLGKQHKGRKTNYHGRVSRKESLFVSRRLTDSRTHGLPVQNN